MKEKLTGMLAEYISYAKDCLGNQTLKFKIQDCNDYDEMLQALIYDNDQDFKSVPLTNILVLLRKARKAEAVAKLAAGMNGHIAKPIQVDKLLSTLKTILTENIIL